MATLLLEVVRGPHWQTKHADGRPVTVDGLALADEALRAAIAAGECCARVRHHRDVLAIACRLPDGGCQVLFREG